MKLILKILFWVWQLPQNMVGVCLTYRHKFKSCVSGKIKVPVYFIEMKSLGICFGDYIFIQYGLCGKGLSTEIKLHEYGHYLLSKIFGPLYLVLMFYQLKLKPLIDSLFHRKWALDERYYWVNYGPLENWANKLANLNKNNFLKKNGIIIFGN